MTAVRGALMIGAGCALVLTWFTALTCAAQHDAAATARSELTHFSPSPLPAVPERETKTVASNVVVEPASVTSDLKVAAEADGRRRAWVVALASTSAAFATSFALTEGYSARATKSSMRDLERSRDVSFDMDARQKAQRQGDSGAERANLLSKVSDVCLAGSVAATGAALLIWLTGKKQKTDRLTNKTLLGPMVLRGANGGGLVLREKF
ncbi:MAG TPA: hypothetical protein VFZ61_20390 [Polyangiales bacterium]